MAGNSKLRSKRTSESKPFSSSNTVQEQPETAKPDSASWYVTIYRPLTPSPIAASSNASVETFPERRPIEAPPTLVKSLPESTDLPRAVKRQRVASWSGSSNAADDGSTIPNTLVESQSLLVTSRPELGKQPNAGKRRETLSLGTRAKLGHLLGPDAADDVAPAGWLTIANPFNYPWEVLARRQESTTPLILCIPRFINSQETLEFMGFEPFKAKFILKAFDNWANLPSGPTLDLLWCAMQYVASVEEEANKEGCFDQRKIKERMGFHWGTALFYIDTHVPNPTGHFFYEREGRVINHIILRICRRYEFLVALENGITNTGMMAWSMVSVPRKLQFARPTSDVVSPEAEEEDQAVHNPTNRFSVCCPIGSTGLKYCREK